MVGVGQLHATGPPVGLGLLQPVLGRGDEVPLDEPLAHRLPAQQHDDGRGHGGDQHRLARIEDHQLALVEPAAVHLDDPLRHIGRALRIVGGELAAGAGRQGPVDVE